MIITLPLSHQIYLYCCYAYQDEGLYQDLEKVLRSLQRYESIQEWHHKQILAGQQWKQEVEKHIDAAHIFIVLLSTTLVASEIYDIEVKRALRRHKKGDLYIIPILARPMSLPAELAELAVLPSNKEPVEKWRQKSEAWFDIEQGIRKVLEQFKEQHRQHSFYSWGDGKRGVKVKPFLCTLSLVSSNSMETIYRLGFPTPDTSLIIGRDENADIRLPDEDKKASRYHCQLNWTPQGIIISDYPSKNRTFVNGQRIDKTIIRPKDSIRCGRTRFFLADYGATESEEDEQEDRTQLGNSVE